MTNRKLTAILLGGAGMTLFQGVASGQVVSAPAQVENSTGEERRQSEQGKRDAIVVTARRREELAQDVPIPMTVFSGDTLDREVAVELSDLSSSIPNVQLEELAVFNGAGTFSIRGMSDQTISSHRPPPAAVFLDGVYQARTQGILLNLFDIESIEVLRGPQGALWGTNALAGAISVRSKRPTGELAAQGQLTLGNYGRTDYSAAVEGPLAGDKLAAKMVYMHQGSDGFYTLVRPGGFTERAGGEDVDIFRSTLVLTPNEDLSATLIGTYIRNRSDSAVIYGARFDGSFAGLFGFPGKNPFGDPRFGIPGDGSDPFIAESEVPTGDKIDTFSAVLEIEYQMAAGKITYLSAYSNSDEDVFTDDDGEIAEIFLSERFQTYTSFQQELRFDTSPTDKTDLLLGLFWFNDKVVLDQTLALGFGAPGDPDLTPPLLPVPSLQFADDPRSAGFIHGRNGQRRNIVAGYASLDYKLTEKLTLEAALRATYEHKRIFAAPLGTGPDRDPVDRFKIPASAFCDPVSGSWSPQLSPRLGAKYQADPDVMLFGLWQRAYRSGGFNNEASKCSLVTETYNLERADNFEVGAKAQFFDRKLTLNLNAFYTIYDDLQRTVRRPAPLGASGQEAFTNNAAGARTYGVEMEARADLGNGLTIDAQVGWLDAGYTEYLADLKGFGDVTDNSSLKLPFAPKWDVTAGAQYRAVTEQGDFTFRADVNHTSTMVIDVSNVQYGIRDPLTKLDLLFGWRSPDRRIEINLFGKNMTNQVERALRLNVGTIAALEAATAPRTWGVSTKARF